MPVTVNFMCELGTQIFHHQLQQSQKVTGEILKRTSFGDGINLFWNLKSPVVARGRKEEGRERGKEEQGEMEVFKTKQQIQWNRKLNL